MKGFSPLAPLPSLILPANHRLDSGNLGAEIRLPVSALPQHPVHRAVLGRQRQNGPPAAQILEKLPGIDRLKLGLIPPQQQQQVSVHVGLKRFPMGQIARVLYDVTQPISLRPLNISLRRRPYNAKAQLRYIHLFFVSQLPDCSQHRRNASLLGIEKPAVINGKLVRPALRRLQTGKVFLIVAVGNAHDLSALQAKVLLIGAYHTVLNGQAAIRAAQQYRFQFK